MVLDREHKFQGTYLCFRVLTCNAGKYVEFAIEGSDYYPWQNNIFTPEFEVRNGNVVISDKPGWGIEINPEWIALSDYRISYMGSRF